MGIEQLEYDSKLRGRVFLALQKAIVGEFDQGDWHEIGHQTGNHQFITGHKRLLRSLSWRDEDYGAHVFEVLEHIARQDVNAVLTLIEHGKIRPYLDRNASDILTDIGLNQANVPAVPPPLSSSDVVRKALADADHLLNSNGATSAIDRLHTALHGYLRQICADAGLQVADNASITALFKVVRTEHQAFADLGTQGGEVGRILMAFSTVIDSINTIRNHASVAHPNEALLEDDEAELAVNAIRTLFNYLVKKVG